MSDVGTNNADPHEQTAADSASPGTLKAGLQLGGFALIAVLGEGGMGTVWSAHDPNLDRTVAIKVLKRSDAAPSLRKRLLREARAMARLKHPHVLTVYEVGTEGERDYIAMELVEGGSLDEWLGRNPPRDDVMRAILAAGRGLAAAHAAGLVHRDFKPHNVLRSRTGRVLVTDFGLARGLGEDSASGMTPEEAVQAPASALHTDSVLDSPLTQTGALIGTPAYMAPEQFHGAAPDPRTDQFAFCVTAWQALTGLRPYTGASLEELRAAAAAGVAPSVKVDLPPEVRAALVRGMDPDPAKRWPSLDELLDVLEHAVRPRRPRWMMPAIAFVALAVIGGTVLIARRGGTDAAAAAGCGPGEDGFAAAWSPAVKAETASAIRGRGIYVPEDVFARVTGPLDAYRERWTLQFASACKAPQKVGARQRACLLGARDQAAALALVLREGPAAMFSKIDLHGMLPDLDACAGESPNVPPHPPDDPVLRDKVTQLMAQVFALAGREDFATSYPSIEAEARTIGWPAMLPMVQMAIGNELLRRGDYVGMRAEMAKVLAAPPETREAKTVAIARLSMIEASLAELEQPDLAGKPGELHPELDRLLRYARADVKAAGNEPALVAALAGLEARAQSGLAQYGRYPKAYDEALAQARKAVELYLATGDLRRATLLAARVAMVLDERGGPNALDDAMFVARTAAERLAAAQLPPDPALDYVRASIELERGEYATAHQLFATAGEPRDLRAAPEVRGEVLDATGKPVANARVVTWRGELAGDPKNLVSDPSEYLGESVESGADGTFVVHALPGDGLVAQLADQRSAPQVVTGTTAMVTLEATAAINGTIDRADVDHVFAIARYAVGTNAWEIRAPAGKDRSFRLAGLPRAGQPLIGTYGSAAQAQRRVLAGRGATQVTWPIGETIEVIVRGPVDPAATAWVFRGDAQPATRAAAEALTDRAGEVAWASLHPVGADNTDAGRAMYEPGDRHALIAGVAAGAVSVCIAPEPRPSAAVSCKAVTVAAQAPAGVVPVIIADGGRGKPAP